MVKWLVEAVSTTCGQPARPVCSKQGLNGNLIVVDASHLCRQHWNRQWAFVLACLLQFLVQYTGFPDWIQSEFKYVALVILYRSSEVSSEHNQENKSPHAFVTAAERLPRQRRRENKTKETAVSSRPTPCFCAIFLVLPPLQMIWYHLQAARFNA